MCEVRTLFPLSFLYKSSSCVWGPTSGPWYRVSKAALFVTTQSIKQNHYKLFLRSVCVKGQIHYSSVTDSMSERGYCFYAVYWDKHFPNTVTPLFRFLELDQWHSQYIIYWNTMSTCRNQIILMRKYRHIFSSFWYLVSLMFMWQNRDGNAGFQNTF